MQGTTPYPEPLPPISSFTLLLAPLIGDGSPLFPILSGQMGLRVIAVLVARFADFPPVVVDSSSPSAFRKILQGRFILFYKHSVRVSDSLPRPFFSFSALISSDSLIPSVPAAVTLTL